MFRFTLFENSVITSFNIELNFSDEKSSKSKASLLTIGGLSPSSCFISINNFMYVGYVIINSLDMSSCEILN